MMIELSSQVVRCYVFNGWLQLFNRANMRIAFFKRTLNKEIYAWCTVSHSARALPCQLKQWNTILHRVVSNRYRWFHKWRWVTSVLYKLTEESLCEWVCGKWVRVGHYYWSKILAVKPKVIWGFLMRAVSKSTIYIHSNIFWRQKR